MKLLHLGDLHLGRSLAEFDLIEDQRYILEQVLKIIEEQAIDAVLIAGDVYDKSVPSEAATNLLDWFLCSLAKKNVDTYLISGNHDSDDRLNYGSRLFENSRIFISSIFDGRLAKYTIKKNDEEADIWLLPFVKASQVRHFYEDAEINSYEDAVRAILDNAVIDESRSNILVAHQFVAGKSERPALGGSESLGTQSVGLVEMIGANLFDKFDYVALGHIHSPQQVGRKEVRYSGSPLKYSLSEVNNEKSVPVITINDKKTEVELVPLKPLRDMRHIKGKFSELLDAKNISDTNDYIYATLTDEDFINDAMSIFQQTYPYTVKIDYDNSRTRGAEQVNVTAFTASKSFSELIGDFYKMMYKTEITDEEMEIMRDVAREAGALK
ncbi:MAG: exonuclease SbcCD subunit D [Lachnospiraceae bacterium]|nr:exonuclease SbcCD subunit D [Lachnospiraceae bacterium]